MKKLYILPKHKLWQNRKFIEKERFYKKRRLEALKKKKSQNRDTESHRNLICAYKKKQKDDHSIFAPSDFRLIENTEKCLLFFRNIRDVSNSIQYKNSTLIIMSLINVQKIDYATVSILTSISDDLKYKGIILQGNFPADPYCKKFMIETGFLSHMVNKQGHNFPKPEKSNLIFFEKGCGILSTDDNKKISKMVTDVVKHLTGEEKHCLPIKTIILEICGNSIEWGGTENKQWLFGVKFEIGKVVFTVTDVGRGILDTLNRKFKQKLSDFISKSDDEILIGAFEKKYGSSTQETNRNKGLPSVKSNFEQGSILELKILTNNVILHFDNKSCSRTFERGQPRFKGTFYQWSMNIDCINNIQIGNNENY